MHQWYQFNGKTSPTDNTNWRGAGGPGRLCFQMKNVKFWRDGGLHRIQKGEPAGCRKRQPTLMCSPLARPFVQPAGLPFCAARQQRWSDSGFLLSDPILFLKNDIRFRSESCFGGNHAIRIRKLSECVLWCTIYIFVLCLFCLVRQTNCWSYFAFSWTWLVKVVTSQVRNACPA